MNHDDQNEKIAALEQRIAALEGFAALQKRALERAHTLLTMHQQMIEVLTGQQPDPASGSPN